MNSQEFFEMQLKRGEMVEEVFKQSVASALNVTSIVHTQQNWREVPYDFKLGTGADTKTFEIKAAFDARSPEGWDRFCAETRTIGSKPMADYRTHHREIDYYVVYSAAQKKFHFYHCTKLAEWVASRQHMEKMNKYGTAYYLHIDNPDYHLVGAEHVGYSGISITVPSHVHIPELIQDKFDK